MSSYIQANFNYLKVKSKIPNTVKTKDGVNFFFSIDNSIYFNSKRTLVGEINYWYDAAGFNRIYDISSSSCLDLAIKYSILNKKIDLSLSASNILKSNVATVKGLSNNIEIQYRNYYFPRYIRFSVVYRFGNENIKSKQKELSNEEERKRLN
jgi:hypothetical protein